MTSQKNLLIVTLNGRDQPGITAQMTEICANEGAKILDLGQSVLHNHLSLSLMLSLSPTSTALKSLLFAAHELGFKLEASPLIESEFKKSTSIERVSFCLTLLGELSSGSALAQLAHFLATKKINIREIKSLSQETLCGVELIVDVPISQSSTQELIKLRGEILSLSKNLNVDIALQKDDIFRRAKRLVCLDVDSTFVQMEVIDELGRLSGCFDQVAKITEAAMRGELNFDEALRKRVALLKGLEFEKAALLLKEIPLSDGVEKMCRTLKKLGLKIGLVSGGFDFFVNHLKEKFQLDFAFANQLKIENGKITGEILGPIVNADRKAQILRDMSHAFNCSLEQCVAIGDGANDLLMLKEAGLGIAYKAKPKLEAAADLAIRNQGLDSILYLMGLSERDFKKL